MPVTATATASHAAFVSCLQTALLERGYGLPACLADLAPTSAPGRFFRTQLESLAVTIGCRIEVVTPNYESGLAWNTHPEPGDLSDAQVLYLCRLREAVLEGRCVIVRTRPLWSLLTGWTDNLTMLPHRVGGGLRADISVEKPYESDCAVVVT